MLTFPIMMCKHSITIVLVDFNVLKYVDFIFRIYRPQLIDCCLSYSISKHTPCVYRLRLSGDLRRLALWWKGKSTCRDSVEATLSGSKWIFRCATLYADGIRVLVLNIFCLNFKTRFSQNGNYDLRTEIS